MSKLEFSPEDFAQAWCTPDTSTREMDVALATAVCRVANAKLREWLKTARELSLTIDEYGLREWADSGITGTFSPTHTARLVEIEEILP